jgi:beta-lactamase superfamily II metal-dependent hydrolase
LPAAPPGALSVSFLDMKGKGESAVIQAPGGAAVVVDGGPKGYAPILLDALRQRRIYQLTGIVATHPDPDHVGGLAQVVATLPVAWLMDSGFPSEDGSYRRLLERVEERKLEYRLGRAGQQIPIEEGVRLQVLGPSEPFLKGTGADADNASIVFRLLHDRVRILFTGDMDAAEQAHIQTMPQAGWFAADVVKLPDDGRLDPAWLKRVRPRLVVIAGTQHGPSSETIQALEKAGIPWKSIHRDGPIVVTSDGRDFQVQSGNEAERGLRRKPG